VLAKKKNAARTGVRMANEKLLPRKKKGMDPPGAGVIKKNLPEGGERETGATRRKGRETPRIRWVISLSQTPVREAVSFA